MGFVAVGLASTACNLASRYLFEPFCGYELALVGANAVGVLSAFVLNRALVFEPTGDPWLVEMGRFTVVNLVGIAVGWAVAVGLFRVGLPAVGWRWHPDLVAHAIGIAVPVLPNYLAHRAWTFNRR